MLALAVLAASIPGMSAHSHLTATYQEYLSSKTTHLEKKHPQVLDIVIPASDNKSRRSKDLFVPPRPNQTPIDFHPQLRQLHEDNEPLVYYSWHIHSYFFHEDANVTARSLDIRTQFINAFNVPACTNECFMGGPFDDCSQGN